MDASPEALIRQPGTSGALEASRVLQADGGDLRTQLAAHHANAFAWAVTCCAGAGGRRQDAEDVLHDVYAAVLEDRIRFEGRSTFRTWLFGVIARVARSRMRRERLRELLRMTRAFRIDVPAAPEPADSRAIVSERQARLRGALERLARRQREVLLLVFYHDLTIEEAAGVMRVSVGSARVHYQRGKERLAALVGSDRE